MIKVIRTNKRWFLIGGAVAASGLITLLVSPALKAQTFLPQGTVVSITLIEIAGNRTMAHPTTSSPAIIQKVVKGFNEGVRVPPRGLGGCGAASAPPPPYAADIRFNYAGGTSVMAFYMHCFNAWDLSTGSSYFVSPTGDAITDLENLATPSFRPRFTTL